VNSLNGKKSGAKRFKKTEKKKKDEKREGVRRETWAENRLITRRGFAEGGIG